MKTHRLISSLEELKTGPRERLVESLVRWLKHPHATPPEKPIAELTDEEFEARHNII